MRADDDVDLRSKSYHLRVTPSSHAPTPFYISSAGYGVVLNAARVLNIQVGIGNRKDSPHHPPELDRNTDRDWSARPESDAVEANVVGTGMEVLLLAGRNPLAVVRRYNLYCGGGCLPARWGLGFWHRVHTKTTAEQALAEVVEFAKRDLPLDVIGLEPGWMSASYPCTYLDMFRQLNRRTCGLVRGSNAGGSPYPFALYSDTYAHRGFIQALSNSSLAGVLWCSEVRDATSDEDWVRRFQTALFSPVMQLNGWSNGVKPWSRATATDLVRDQLKLRMRLTPYLYTTMADYHRDGVPPIRHMVLEAGASSSAEVIPGQLDGPNLSAELKRLEISDQYMFGPSILVAPLIAGEKSRKVVLPQGKWFDFYTGKLVGEETTITASAPLDQIPLFVKDGGIVPLMPAVNNLRLAKGPVALEVRHYGAKEGSYLLYDDDGESFDYEQGISSRQELRAVRVGGKLQGEVGATVGPWKSHNTSCDWKFMTQTPDENGTGNQ
jgi:alpha-glucosidase (family GH31 glycosyl hydrolase)